MEPAPRPRPGPAFPRPPADLAAQADALLERARSEPGGVALLLHGWEESVAAHFRVSAFVVNEARQRLADRREAEA